MDFTEDRRAVALLTVTYRNAVTATENHLRFVSEQNGTKSLRVD